MLTSKYCCFCCRCCCCCYSSDKLWMSSSNFAKSEEFSFASGTPGLLVFVDVAVVVDDDGVGEQCVPDVADCQDGVSLRRKPEVAETTDGDLGRTGRSLSSSSILKSNKEPLKAWPFQMLKYIFVIISNMVKLFGTVSQQTGHNPFFRTHTGSPKPLLNIAVLITKLYFILFFWGHQLLYVTSRWAISFYIFR